MQSQKKKQKSKVALKSAPKVKSGKGIGKTGSQNIVSGVQKIIGGPMSMNMVGAYENFSFSLGREFQTVPLNINGKTGLRMRGVCPIASITTDGKVTTGGGCLDIFLPSTPVPKKAIAFHPNYLFPGGSQEDDISTDYTRYRFNKARLIFTTLTGSNQTRCIALSFYGDGVIVGGTVPTMNSASLMPGSATLSTWVPIRQMDISKYLDTDDWFYIDVDDANLDTSNRQCFQGAILGYWINPQAASLTDGTLWLEYELDLLESRVFQNLALKGSLRKRSPRKIHSDFRVRNPQRADRIPGREIEPVKAPAQNVQEDSDLDEGFKPSEQLLKPLTVDDVLNGNVSVYSKGNGERQWSVERAEKKERKSIK